MRWLEYTNVIYNAAFNFVRRLIVHINIPTKCNSIHAAAQLNSYFAHAIVASCWIRGKYQMWTYYLLATLPTCDEFKFLNLWKSNKMAEKYQHFFHASISKNIPRSTWIKLISMYLFFQYSQPADVEGAMKYSPKKGAYTKVKRNLRLQISFYSCNYSNGFLFKIGFAGLLAKWRENDFVISFTRRHLG